MPPNTPLILMEKLESRETKSSVSYCVSFCFFLGARVGWTPDGDDGSYGGGGGGGW